jgi:hypothetical protein
VIFGAEQWLEVNYAYIPEGNARRSGIRVPIVRDHDPAWKLLGFGRLAGHADNDQYRTRFGALAPLTAWRPESEIRRK